MTRRLVPVADNPSRVVLYVRVSAVMDRGGDNFHAPKLQLGAMRRLTAGLREIAVVEDIDRSGRTFDRQGITRIRGMAERGEMDALAVYDVSRLGRNVRESLTFLAQMADLGVTILSATEHIDTSTPAGRLMLTNMLAVAEFRSDEIGRSWSATVAERARNGIHHGHPRGYTRDDQGRLTPHPIVGPAVARVWQDFAAGKPMRQICREFAAVWGAPVATSNLKTIFKRPVYLGHVVADGEIVVRDAHPPLVDQRTWDLAQQRLARDRTVPPRRLQVTWALSGFAYCFCGAHIQRMPRMRRGVREQRLICGSGPGRVGGGCVGIGAPLMQPFEDEVLRRVGVYVQQLRTDDGARAEQLVRRTSAIADGRALKRRLAVVQEGIARLAKAWALGDLDADEYRPASAELKSERDALRDRLAALGDVEELRTSEQAATAAEALLSMWPDMLVHERNLALRDVVDRVTIRRGTRWREPYPDRLDVTWR
jgi:site-specific DNA recombinase